MSTMSPDGLASALRARVASGSHWLEVEGSSMGSTIRSGSRVEIVASAPPRRGEVWAYCDRHGRVVVHRFIGAGHGTYRFAGDGPARSDPSVPPSWAIGRVTAVETDDGVVEVSRTRWRAGLATLRSLRFVGRVLRFLHGRRAQRSLER
jgi:hypothetical protein